jgi:hypothetical protein
MEPVKIELNESDLQTKTDSEKLNLLVKIAFMNHDTLQQQSVVLFGNGDPTKGICSKVAMQGSLIKWMIGVFSTCATVIAGIIVKHIMG